jgi:uncharacterized protein YndB with AHSA1/START domain
MKTEDRATLTMPSDLEIVITRRFRAPRALVFEAWSKPEHVRRWFGLPQLTLAVCEMDFREGGTWRWVLRDPSAGVDHAFSGEYREIARPERLVYTERYEAIPDSDHVVTITFEERDHETIFTEHVNYRSVEHRDGHLASGMEEGMQQTLARLESLLSTLGDAAATVAR